ncbi:hypothetical protein GCM10029964_004320 [Kibdelosporangium lantanae]
MRDEDWLRITSLAPMSFTQWPLDITSAGSVSLACGGLTTDPEQLLNATIPVKSALSWTALAGAVATEPIASAVNSAPATRLIIIGGFLPIAGCS